MATAAPAKPQKNLETLKLEEIILDKEIQQRANWRANSKDVVEYTQLVRQGVRFPAIVVYEDEDGSTFLADGWTRYHAFKNAGKVRIAADVRKGTKQDAIWFATSANKTHGFHRTNEDKRKAVTTALTLKPELSDKAIAEHVGVSGEMVGDVRAKLEKKGELAERKEIKTKSGAVVKNDAKAKAQRKAAGTKGAAAKTGIAPKGENPMIMPATAPINDGVVLDGDGTPVTDRKLKAVFKRVQTFQKMAASLQAAAKYYDQLVAHEAGTFLGAYDGQVLRDLAEMIDAATPMRVNIWYGNGWEPKNISQCARNQELQDSAKPAK